MKIINFLFALTSFASATLQLIAQNKLYNAIGSHNKHRNVRSLNTQMCLQFLEKATTNFEKSRALASFYCVNARKENKTSKNQKRAKINSFRNRRFRDSHRQ